ncbi:MAG: Asp-tRNA(Asn)/Glu-tRNA(Gln) amidotransferase subunit GatB [Bacteroidota bacterium]
MNTNYEAVIGLEVHVQLLTESKTFCGCRNKFGMPPNTNVCPVCMGHPGTLPVLNKKVVEFAVLLGLATNSKINFRSIFARKNYFYPDLPKGWQTSQFAEPICEKGYIDIEKSNGENKRINLTRIHIEEDAGKLIHDQGDESLVDLNRCGTPLLEIVSEPDIGTPEEAYLYLTKIKQLVTYLGICDGTMEEGSLRCDANISIRKYGEKKLGTKTEVKNMNSFRNVEKAISAEIERQLEIIEDGGTITQQTLLWNADKGTVNPMRSKEESHDYRYFPEPDLMPVVITDKWMSEISCQLPELPDQKRTRFIEKYSLPLYDAEILTGSVDLANYYENVISATKDYKSASNWMMGDVLKVLNDEKMEITSFHIAPINLGKLINLINDGVISGKIAKDVFAEMLKSNAEPNQIVNDKNLIQITDANLLEEIIETIVSNNLKQVEQYKAGKTSVIGFFVGHVMRETKGKANPELVNTILKEKLG